MGSLPRLFVVQNHNGLIYCLPTPHEAGGWKPLVHALCLFKHYFESEKTIDEDKLINWFSALFCETLQDSLPCSGCSHLTFIQSKLSKCPNNEVQCDVEVKKRTMMTEEETENPLPTCVTEVCTAVSLLPVRSRQRTLMDQ